MASLNKDEIFWLHLHNNNVQLKEKNQPIGKMPNLGMLQESLLGTHPELESKMHDQIIEFLTVLKAPTTHKYHYTKSTTHKNSVQSSFSAFAHPRSHIQTKVRPTSIQKSLGYICG